MKVFNTIIVAALSFAMIVHAKGADNKCMPSVRSCNKRSLDSRNYAYPMGGIVSSGDVKEIEDANKVEATKEEVTKND
jgi:hypothetical protein